MCALDLGHLKTQKLIGRIREKEIIQAAIEADQELRVIYLIGEAGIGKTRLLNEVPALIEESTARGRCVYGGLFDLYHVDTHTNSGIEMAVAEALDPQKEKNKHFAEYRIQRRRFERLRKAGVASEQLEELRQKLGGLFIEAFNRFTAQRRVVLCFDTVELVQYEGETVHELFAVSHGGVEVREWLGEYIPQLQNAVVILAGRPRTPLWTDLQGQLAERLGEPLELDERSPLAADLRQVGQVAITVGPLDVGFAPDSYPETAAYFTDLAGQNERIRRAELRDEHYADIYRVTQGRPLHLAFIATLIAQDERLPGELLEDVRDELEEQIKEQMLIAVWRLSPEIEAVLPYVAWLRKGVNAVLLSRVLTDRLGNGWKQGRCRRILADLRELPFVKTRAGSSLVFLHDEMYDLMDHFVLDHLAPTDRQATCQVAQAYYNERIEKASGRKRQGLIIERLYYQLLENPAQGFYAYEWLDNEALTGLEVGFEMSLRDEMLRFFAPQLKDEQGNLTRWGRRVARDGALRAVIRPLRRGRHTETRSIAEQILAYGADPFKWEEAPLMTTALLIFHSEALGYLGTTKEAIEQLERAVELMEQAEVTAEREQNRRYLLSLAYKHLGYAYTRQRDYGRAIGAYTEALDCLEPLAKHGIQAAQNVAQTETAHIQRNLAFIYGESGKWIQAIHMCEKSLEAFRALGYRWGEASALNTYGGIEAKFHHPHRARKRCQKALDIFTALGDDRGIGLSKVWLALALRRMGAQSIYRAEAESERFFRQAEALIQETETIFKTKVNEPIRLVYATAERGRLYRDWAKTCRYQGGKYAARVEGLAKQAEGALQEAIAQADEGGMIAEAADIRQDLADLYEFLGEGEKALTLLDEAEGPLPKSCILSPQRPYPELKCPVPGYLEILGKIYMARGHVAYARQEPLQAIEWWTLAFGYFKAYSPGDTRLVGEAATGICGLLLDEMPKRLRQLRDHCVETEAQYSLPVTRLHTELDELI